MCNPKLVRRAHEEALVAQTLAALPKQEKHDKKVAKSDTCKAATSSTSSSSITTTPDAATTHSSLHPHRRRGRRPQRPEPVWPVAPLIIQSIPRRKGVANHSYRDFSCVPPMSLPVEKDLDRMTFAQKLHHLLSQSEYEPYISWLPHGRAFQVLVPKKLEDLGILQKYFGHSRYSSFLRQLAMYGLKLLTKVDRNAYYHELMLRGKPHLAVYMPDAKDARRQQPDPDHEPDFYKISQCFPLVKNDKEGTAPPISSMTPALQTLLAASHTTTSTMPLSTTTSSITVSPNSQSTTLPWTHDLLVRAKLVALQQHHQTKGK